MDFWSEEMKMSETEHAKVVNDADGSTNRIFRSVQPLPSERFAKKGRSAHGNQRAGL